jgi:hypothetical protein
MLYHFRSKHSTAAGNCPRLADSSLAQSVTKTDDDSAPAAVLLKRSGSSHSLSGVHEHDGNENVNDSFINVKRSASGNLLVFRRRKGSVDEHQHQHQQQLQESKSRARAQNLYAEYEHANDKDETLNPGKGNFKSSEAAITTMTPSLVCKSVMTAKPAQALYYAKTKTRQPSISGEFREPKQRKKNKAELHSKTQEEKEAMFGQVSNIGSTPTGHREETEMICASKNASVLLLEKKPDCVLPVVIQSNRGSYGKKQKTQSRAIEMALAARHHKPNRNNNNNNMTVSENDVANDGVECVFPKSLACALSPACSSLTFSMNACFNSKTHEHDDSKMQPNLITTIRQLPELC